MLVEENDGDGQEACDIILECGPGIFVRLVVNQMACVPPIACHDLEAVPVRP